MIFKGYCLLYRYHGRTKRISHEQSVKLKRVLAQRAGKYLTDQEIHRISVRYHIPQRKCRQWFMNRGVKIRVGGIRSSITLAPQLTAKFSKRLVQEIEKRYALGAILFRLPYGVQITMLKRSYNAMLVRAKFVEELAAELKLPVKSVSNWMTNRAKKNRTSAVSNLTISKQAIMREEMNKSLEFDDERVLMLAYILDLPATFVQKLFNDKRGEIGLAEIDVITELETQSNAESKFDENIVVQPESQEEKDKMSIVLTPCNWENVATPSSTIRASSTSFTTSRKPKKHFYSPQIISALCEEFKKSNKLPLERADQIASEIGLESIKVQRWFTKQRMKVDGTSLSQVELLLNQNLQSDQVSKLENVFRQKTAVSLDEARELGEQLSLYMKQVLNWFTRRRLYDILKSYTTNEQQVTVVKRSVVQTAEELRPEECVASSYRQYKRRLLSLDKIPAATRIRLLREETRDSGIAAEQIPQLAAELNISQDFIHRFIMFRRGNTRKSTSVFSTEDLLLLEEQYAVKDRISKDEAIALSRQMSGRGNFKQILNWFANTRIRRSVVEESITTTLTPIAAVNREYVSNESQSVAPVLKSTTYKTFLFEEFKRSRSMDPTRRNHLAMHLGLTSTQVFLFFRSLLQSLNKPIGTVMRTLMSMSHSQLVKLTAEYHKSRFIAGIKRQTLAKQLGVSKLAIIQWFHNARYYELKTGEKFKPTMAAATLQQKKFGPKNDETIVAEDPAVSNQRKSNGLNYKREQILRAELMKSDQLTPSRLLSLSKRLHLRFEIIKKWFAENSSLAKRGLVRGKENEATEKSTTTTTKFYRKLPLQKDMLFEEFKRTPSLANERMTRLARQMDLSRNQVYYWFYDMRKKLAATPDEVLAPEYRNRNLDTMQIARLEAEFAKHPYERNEISELLESELKLSPGQIRSWFDSRRLYDIRAYWRKTNRGEGVETRFEEKESIRGGGGATAAEWSFKPIITAIESKQHEEAAQFNELFPVKIEKFSESVSMVEVKEEPCDLDTEITEWDCKSEPDEDDDIGETQPSPDNSPCDGSSVIAVKDEPWDADNEEQLELEFAKESYPTSNEISSLASKLNVSQERVNCWFKSRRARSVPTIEETGIEFIPEEVLQMDLTDNDAETVVVADADL